MIRVLKLIRAHFTVPLSLGLAVIVYWLRNGDVHGYEMDIATGCLSLFFLISAGYSLNDAVDIDIDAIVRPTSVLVQKQLRRSTAIILSVLFFSAALVLAIATRPLFGVIIIFDMVLLVFYDLYSKRIGFFKDLIIAFLMASLYLLAFSLVPAVISPRRSTLFYHAAWLFLASLSYEMFKDTTHREGDSQSKGRGFRISAISGRLWYIKLAKICYVVSTGILAIPAFLGYCGITYLVTVVSCLVLAFFVVRSSPEKAVRLGYIHIFLLTGGAFLDLFIERVVSSL